MAPARQIDENPTPASWLGKRLEHRPLVGLLSALILRIAQTQCRESSTMGAWGLVQIFCLDHSHSVYMTKTKLGRPEKMVTCNENHPALMLACCRESLTMGIYCIKQRSFRQMVFWVQILRQKLTKSRTSIILTNPDTQEGGYTYCL